VPKRVLAALDLAPAAATVVRWGHSIAPAGGLTALHVFEAPFAGRLRGYGVSRKALDVYASDQREEREAALNALLADAGIGSRSRVTALVLRGEALKSLSAQIRKLDIDTLAIGKHTRHKRDAAAPYGSVCHYLAYFAPVDVLVVP
jgi:nucleotide-binding universal stress UspA family protein